MIKNDTIIPITYSSVIGPPLQTVAAADIQACDYKKHHRNENKYNVSHLTAPKSRLHWQGTSATLMPVVWIAKSFVFRGRQTTRCLQFARNEWSTFANCKQQPAAAPKQTRSCKRFRDICVSTGRHLPVARFMRFYKSVLSKKGTLR